MRHNPTLVVKDYKYWSLQVNEDQSYLGRSVIWCKREDADDLEEANPEEQEELFLILSELKRVLSKTFKPDLLNYTFLGNKSPHLHCHVIPRYRAPREFAGETFIDKKWGKNPYKGGYEAFVSPEVSEQVRVVLGRALEERGG